MKQASNQELLFQTESYLEQYKLGTMKEETAVFFIWKALSKLNQWKDYPKVKPETNKDYLVFFKERAFMDIRYFDKEGFDSNDEEISHWLTLPEPPN